MRTSNALSLPTAGAFKLLRVGGNTVSDRLFNSVVDSSGASAGLISDAITYISPDFAPEEAPCPN